MNSPYNTQPDVGPYEARWRFHEKTCPQCGSTCNMAGMVVLNNLCATGWYLYFAAEEEKLNSGE